MNRILENMQPFALLVLRATLGLIMTTYGWLKVSGGMAEFKGFVVTIGFPGWMGYLAAYGEFLGGILLIVGLLTRFAGLTILIVMAVAVAKVTWKNGLTGPQGFGFPLALAAMAFLLIFFGGGPISLDTAIFHGAKKGSGK